MHNVTKKSMLHFILLLKQVIIIHKLIAKIVTPHALMWPSYLSRETFAW